MLMKLELIFVEFCNVYMLNNWNLLLNELIIQSCQKGFTTGNMRTFERFFGEYKEGSHDFDECIQIIASRLSTVFFSMKVQFFHNCVLKKNVHHC
jgi:hypothetical protein